MDQDVKQEFESLAILIQKGFEEQMHVFDQKLEKQTMAFDAKLEAQTKSFDQKLNERIGVVEFKIVSLGEEMRAAQADTNQRIDKLYEAVDHFIYLHQQLETELVALRGYCQRLEQRIEQLEAQMAV
jgi:phage shock protein A